MANKAEEVVKQFYAKCAKLDVPPECYPEQPYLQKIFRQRLSLFESFLLKVDAKSDVDRVRKNILIQLKLSANKLSSSSQNSVPREYSNYVKFKMLHEKAQALQSQNESLKQQEQQRLQTIQHNDQRQEKVKEGRRANKLKLDMLQAKSMHLNEQLAKEAALEEKISRVMPRKFYGNDSMEEHVRRINEAIGILRKFSSQDADASNNVMHSTKERFWSDISEKVTDVPNVVLFQYVLKQLDAKTSSSTIAMPNATEQKSKSNAQKIADRLLPSFYEHKIVCGIELLSLRKQLADTKSTCAEIIQTLENEMDALLNTSMDFSMEGESYVIDDFVTALIAKLNCEGKNLYCSNAIGKLREQIDNNANVREYERVLNDTKEIYGVIEEKSASVQEHVAQVHQINEKINFSKISLMRMIQSLKMEKCQQHNRTLMNQTLNSTITPNKLADVNMPAHESELQTFLEAPIQNLDRGIDMHRVFLMSDEKIMANLALSKKHFLYPHDFLAGMEMSFKWAALLKPLALDLEPTGDASVLEDVDVESLERQYDDNCEEISSMLDNIAKFNVMTQSHLRNMRAFYEYGIRNPLRKYIPPSKKYLEKTYSEYEMDYMLYYNMIKN